MSVPTYDITPPNPRRENRRNAREHISAGATLAGAGTAASFGANRVLRRKLGYAPGLKAELKARVRPKHLGVKLGARSAQITGLGLAAAGVKHLVRPDEDIAPVNVRDDVVRPMARAATFQPASKALGKPPKPLGLSALGTHGMLRPKRTTAAQDALKREMGLYGRPVSPPAKQRAADEIDDARRAARGRGVEKSVVSKIAPRVTYHGTSTRKARRILAAGRLEPSRGGFYPGKVSTGPREVAEDYAHGRSRRGKGAVLSVTTVGPARGSRTSHAFRPEDVLGVSKALMLPRPRAMRTRGQLVPRPRSTRAVGVSAASSMPGVSKAGFTGPVRSTARIRLKNGVLERKSKGAPLGFVKRPSFAADAKGNVSAVAHRTEEAGDAAAFSVAPVAPQPQVRDLYSAKVRKTVTWTGKDQERLGRRRRVGGALSVAGGTMGLAALGLRAPAAAKVAVRRGAKWAEPLARREVAATGHSNTLGVAAIGTGSAGSFNYASQQKLERRKERALAVAKARNPWSKREQHVNQALLGTAALGVPAGAFLGAGAQYAGIAVHNRNARRYNSAIEHTTPVDRSMVIPGQDRPALSSRKQGPFPSEHRVDNVRVLEADRHGVYHTPYAQEQRALRRVKIARGLTRAGQHGAVAGIAASVGSAGVLALRVKNKKAQVRARKMAVAKAESHLSTALASRVSPQAEASYNRMHRDRRTMRAEAVGQGALAGILGASTAEQVRHGGIKSRWGIAASTAGTITTAYGAYRSAKQARGRTRAMSGIEAAGRRRARAKQYGAGRGLSPVDPTSRARNLASAASRSS